MFIEIYTDGANMQASRLRHAGSAAVLLLYPDRGYSCINPNMKAPKEVRLVGRYVGLGSNNVAELLGVSIGLTMARVLLANDVEVVTDSQYCWGLLDQVQRTEGFWDEPMWRFTPAKNLELVKAIRRQVAELSRYTIRLVKGHAGDKWNNLADAVACWCKDRRQDFDMDGLSMLVQKQPWLRMYNTKLGSGPTGAPAPGTSENLTPS